MQRGRKLCGLSSRRGKEDDERIEEERRVVEARREKASSSSLFFGICLQLGRDKLPRNERRTRGKKETHVPFGLKRSARWLRSSHSLLHLFSILPSFVVDLATRKGDCSIFCGFYFLLFLVVLLLFRSFLCSLSRSSGNTFAAKEPRNGRRKGGIFIAISVCSTPSIRAAGAVSVENM